METILKLHILIQVDRFEKGEGRNKVLLAVDVWIQCTRAGLDSILENDGDIGHVNSTDPAPRIWLEPTENSRDQQYDLKSVPHGKLDSFFVQRG